MINTSQSSLWVAGLTLLVAANYGLALSSNNSNSNNNQQQQQQHTMISKRPIVSLTGEGDVSGFLYGKLQRATSIYGSGLIGPATAIVHGQKDLSQLLPRRVSLIATPQKQIKDLENMLWDQFGMATCEGSVEREDLMTPMSYLKPRLSELNHTLVFLDATTTSTNQKNDAGGGLGGLFSSILSKNKPNQQQKQQQQQASEQPEYWLDKDLVRTAVTRGASVFVVCESKDTEDCARALADCVTSLEDASSSSSRSIVTLVAPDDNVELGGSNDDANWNSLRPQDLEGELSKTISVRDGTADCFAQLLENNNNDGSEDEEVANENAPPQPSFKRTREERLAAAYAEDLPAQQATQQQTQKTKGSEARIAAASADYKPPSNTNLSMHDLAEVCVQCALRLPTTTSDSDGKGVVVRVVKVSSLMDDELQESETSTERPNNDYFSLTGGPKAKAKAGVVSSVDWVRTLSCLVTSDGDVRVFPKRPDVR